MRKIEKWQWIVFVTSFAQLISPGLLTVLGYSVSVENSEPQITPAEYTFVIWGVITLLSFFYGVFQLFPGRINKQLHFQLSKGLSIVYFLFVLWLITAVLDWLLITVLIFLVMFVILTVLFDKLIRERQNLTFPEKIILFGQIAMYTGWTTIAIFANTASAVKYYGITDNGFTGILWQSIILVIALINGKYWLGIFKQNVIYGLTIIWALVGVFSGLLQHSNNLVLRLIVGFGIILVLAHLLSRDTLSKIGIKGAYQ